MSAFRLNPCGDVLTDQQLASAIEAYPHSITINDVSREAFRQLNEQLSAQPLTCPLCQRQITQIDPSQLPNQKYPTTYGTLAHMRITSLSFDLHAEVDSAARISTIVNFTEILLPNIINQGQSSQDGGRTYRHLADLSNDFNALISSQGSIMGRIIYMLPVSMKAAVFIRGMEKNRDEKNPAISWLMTDNRGQTIGIVGLSKIKNEEFQLQGEWQSKKLYNVGVFLHSKFQRRGIVSALAGLLFNQIGRLQLDIDALWVMTRPDNNGVNYIAHKLNFTFLKRFDLQHPSFFPCCSQSTTTLNLYVKPLT